ncbi:iron complex transport system substrate-binding protein [Filimonas lacunae]|uniref:Iron complex transport system substrate-binding protein n=1 Tax=Filimonas lacunae TaxID=477680 RepID=A0A173MBV8_9BACT|nr:ABC transporter substrate-binding protein [Filimonas lacunae]BAV05064.1 heme ABC transporter, cell surface heme and hemoprotein receptor HmuT [Filimonas lacunae]SIT34288.1 iron complex transport system substrate-binding protein [Filimonas lacunae]
MKKLLLTAVITLSTLATQAQQRIVSLNGAISEILCALDAAPQIVGVDVTSNYPEVLKSKTKVGHNRNISAEGVLSLQPTMVITFDNQLNSQLLEQLKAAKVNTVILKQDLSVAGTRKLIAEVAAAIGQPAKAVALQKTFDKQMAAVKTTALHKKVLFIYARGAGAMQVSGTGTSIDKMITLAGGENAMTSFSDFKPLSSEALVAANPDVILMFDSGLGSIGGADGLIKMPGVAQTNAGKNKKVISMDGELLSGFSIRLPQAIQELYNKLK